MVRWRDLSSQVSTHPVLVLQHKVLAVILFDDVSKCVHILLELVTRYFCNREKRKNL